MIYAKIGALLALVLGLFGTGWFVGSLKGRASVSALQASQAENTAKAVLAERASAQTELTRLRIVVANYENTPIDPVSVGLGHRVYLYARAANCPVPVGSANPSGTVAPSPVASGFEGALQGYIDACSRDAKRLDALIDAWPQ